MCFFSGSGAADKEVCESGNQRSTRSGRSPATTVTVATEKGAAATSSEPKHCKNQQEQEIGQQSEYGHPVSQPDQTIGERDRWRRYRSVGLATQRTGARDHHDRQRSEYGHSVSQTDQTSGGSDRWRSYRSVGLATPMSWGSWGARDHHDRGANVCDRPKQSAD